MSTSPPGLDLSQLSPLQRMVARELWAALMPAPSHDALMAARQKLKEAAPQVQTAVTKAMVLCWARGQDAIDVPNPFD